MKFDRNILGKFLINENILYYVCAYDFLNQVYLGKDIDKLFSIYRRISDKDITQLKTKDEVIKEINGRLELCEYADNLLKSCAPTFTDKLTHVIEMQENIKGVEFGIQYSKDKQKIEYEHELNHTKKGFRRALLKLIATIPENNRDEVLKFLEEYGYKAPYQFRYQKEKYTKLKSDIKNIQEIDWNTLY